LRPVRAGSGWNEDDFVEPDVVSNGLGNEKMPIVNGVEAAAEDPDVNALPP